MAKASVNDVEFLPLLAQPAEVIESIRQIRNADGVRKFMYNEHLITPEEHQAWISSLHDNPREMMFVIQYQQAVVGLVALRSISWPNRTADWAFYLSEAMQGKGVGGVVEFKLLDKAFFEVGLEKLNCEVLEINPTVIEMHQKFGFAIEGVRRAHVVKGERRLDVCLLGVLKTEWLEKRERFVRLFGAEGVA